MAEVVQLGEAGPVNAGEQRVLDHFVAVLAPSTRIFPNVQVLVGHQQLVECDQILITEDRVWVIEVKDLFGHAQFLKEGTVVDGDVRADAVDVTKRKAQQIKSRLSKAGLGDGLYVEYLVVLAKQPQQLEVAPDYAPFVRLFENAAARIDRPTEHGLPKRWLEPDQRTAIEHELDLRPRVRDEKPRFGNLQAEELTAQASDRQWWTAREIPLGVPWKLEVLFKPKGIGDAAWKYQEDLAIENARMLKVLSGAPGILVPHTAVRGSDGTLAIAHPFTNSPSLLEHGDANLQWSDRVRRSVLRTIGRALDAARNRGIAHRLIGPAVIHVDAESGRTRLTRFSLAHRDGDPDRVPPEVWPHLAEQIWASPEHVAGGLVDQDSDLFALGRLAQHLWPDGAPDDLAPGVQMLLGENPAQRAAGLDALRTAFAPEVGAPREPIVGANWAGYRLEEQLGIGVEAGVSVWRGVAELSGRQVVLRIVDADEDHDGITGLANALSGVDHPAIAEIIAAVIEEGRPTVITEIVPGGSLRSVLEQHGALGREAAVTAAVQLLDGLTRVHPGRADAKTPIVHRRISADNVIIHPERGAVLVNFGPPAGPESQAALNDPRYRPLNEGVRRDDPDGDLFAIAVLIHELATGQHPFTDDDPLTGGLRVDGALDEALIHVLGRALARQRNQRYSTAHELLDALIGLGLPEVRPPAVAEAVVDKVRAIETAMREQRWDDAIGMCPENWEAVRARIEAERAAWERVAGSEVVLELGGFRMRLLGEELACARQLVDGTEAVGDLRIHLLDREDGVTLEISTFLTAQRTGFVVVSDTHHSEAPFPVLENRLRIGLTPTEDGQIVMQLRQGRLKVAGTPGPKDGGAFRASEEELDKGAGVDVRATLEGFGATAYGLEAELLPPKKRQSNYLCAIFPPDAVDLPAVACLVTRVLPIANGVLHE